MNKHKARMRIGFNRRTAFAVVAFVGISMMVRMPYAHAATPTFVQSAYARTFNNSATATFGSNVQQGDVIAVGIAWASSSITLSSLTSTCVSGNLTVVDPTVNANQAASFAMGYGVVAASGSCSVTVTLSGNAGDVRLAMQEISGINTADILDTSSTAALDYGQVPLSSGTSTTNVSGDYIFGYGVNFDATSYTAGTGFTLRVNQSGYATEDTIQSASGPVSATFSTGGSGYNDVGMMALIPAGAGSSGAPTVNSFSEDPPYVPPSGTSTLSWSVGNASSVVITPDGVTTSTLVGSWVVHPTSTTTYTLVATSPNGTSSATTTVTVDPSTPTPPTGLTAIPLSSSQVNLSWASSTDSGGSGIAEYEIFRCEGASCTPTTTIGTSSQTSYGDTSLTAATAYTYAVTAVNGAGTPSGISAPVSTTTKATNYDVYADFESGSNGQAISTSTLNGGTPCNAAPGGAWSLGGTASTQMAVSTAAEEPLLGPITACGTTYTPTDGTRGITYNLNDGGKVGSADFSWNANSNNASDGIWVNIGVPTTDTGYYSMFLISDGTGDFVSMMVHSGQVYIETGANPNGPPDVGTPFAYTQNTWYWVTEQFQTYTGPTSMHSLDIYNASGTLLSAQRKYAATYATVQPYEIYIGRGGDTGTPNDLFYYDNFIADTTGATFPVLPGVAPSPPAISSFTASPSSIASGSSTVLSWNISSVTGAATTSLVTASGTVIVAATSTRAGSVRIYPTSTTQYILTAANAEGTSTASTSVQVSLSPTTLPASGNGGGVVVGVAAGVGAYSTPPPPFASSSPPSSTPSSSSTPLSSSGSPSPSASLPTSVPQLKLLLASLLTEVHALLQRAALQNSTSTSSGASPHMFTRNLMLGDSGPDVKALQEYLNAHGFVLAQEGPGAPGHETDYFGPKTRSSLSRFQRAHGILPSLGYFGPRTRGFIATD